MALARLALKNLHQRVLYCPSSSSFIAAGSSLIGRNVTEVDAKRYLSTESVKIMDKDDKVASETSDGKEVATSSSSKEGKPFKSWFSRKPRKRGLWRSRNDRDFVPAALFEFFPSGLGNALIQASENVNRVLENLNVTPWSLSMRVKEQNDCYKLRFDVPGLRKEDLKIVVDDGVLIINGEHKEEKNRSDSDDESYSGIYGYYHTNLVLPDDAKVDEISAELKNGVLSVVVPRTHNPKKEVKEVQIQ